MKISELQIKILIVENDIFDEDKMEKKACVVRKKSNVLAKADGARSGQSENIVWSTINILNKAAAIAVYEKFMSFLYSFKKRFRGFENIKIHSNGTKTAGDIEIKPRSSFREFELKLKNVTNHRITVL